MLAILVGYVRDFDVAEDVLQDAVVAALDHWPRQGVPDRPQAWLLQTARRKAIDRFRRATNFETKRAALEVMLERERQAQHEADEVPMAAETIPDERLRLIFTCCHPAIAESARVALTLRTLGGLTTAEIARAFLVPEPTMAQRLVRAKAKIRAANIPYRVPPPHLWLERLDSVLAVIYLIFNEGYAAASGSEATRSDLCREAIRLGRILVRVAPGEPEAEGLLALMLLHDSRRSARTNDAGELVALSDQDRSLWDRAAIDEGVGRLESALRHGRLGQYQVQAAISAVHAQAESHDGTDWREIVLLYRKLHELQPSSVVALNLAVALAESGDPERALALLDGLGGDLDRYQPFHAARADVLRRLGRSAEAATAYADAIALTGNVAARRFLEQRLAALSP